jgi:ornithine--oxo-acid transaminase/putrescine aminotransferase
MTVATERPATLVVRSTDLFAGLADGEARRLERAHGNRDLIDLIDVLGLAGPMRTVTPWELEDAEGRHLIHAGGYAAVPFGENYPPLRDAIARHLMEARDTGFPQQSISAWRGAVAANLVALLAAVAGGEVVVEDAAGNVTRRALQ